MGIYVTKRMCEDLKKTGRWLPIHCKMCHGATKANCKERGKK